MRGGLERWKRGVDSHGVHAAIAYALDGDCDAGANVTHGVDALTGYSEVEAGSVTRFIVEPGNIRSDELNRSELTAWVDGCDPKRRERRGRELSSPHADLILDGTINAPKSFSIAAMLHPEIATEFEALQDRLRDRIMCTWLRELNARRGAGGRLREYLARLEVVELRHRRSRALDPHIHRHLWLNVKVKGVDGCWSNVDSRVAMRLHTLINAEGELAARTDPRWREVLASHGFTLDADGEIAELVHAVRPLSRRSNQIEANRAEMLLAWRAAHPGTEPDREALLRIDRSAWAKDRPRKPSRFDEGAWEDLIRDELRAIDPGLLRRDVVRSSIPAPPVVDLGGLALQALADADRRSASSSGRFSLIDVRAGATRAVAGSGIVAPREELQRLIDEVTRLACADVVDLLPDASDRPQHVKALMATRTAALKVELSGRFEDLSRAGETVPRARVVVAAAVVLGDVSLDADQVDAAAAIAGTDRLVTVTGPAGVGKTTVLRVAKRLLDRERRRMVVVAPTKKAASVVTREVGAPGSSLHALLADYGFRWTADAGGIDQWVRLLPGQSDSHRATYPGPRQYPLAAGDRIIVDEAGMVDLQAARALAMVAAETGAGIVMVGDHLQAMPVGHAGAMSTMARYSSSVIEMSSVHRFRDPKYAALTLRLREPATRRDARDVATALIVGGHVHLAQDAVAARGVMVARYFDAVSRGERLALVTATNDEADAVNASIQQRRIDAGELSVARVAIGMDGQRVLEGDIVQTRRNDAAADVANRSIWIVRGIRHDAVELASITDASDVRAVSRDYVADHLRLAYASTVHGVQGETTDASLVGPGVNAAGLYVGMTRGRNRNEAIVVLGPNQTAVDELADTMMRGRPEITLEDARRAAREEFSRAARMPEEPDFDERAAELARVDEWIAAATSAMQSTHSAHATAVARSHGRDASVPPLAPKLAKLADLLTSRVVAAERARSALTEGTRPRPPADVSSARDLAPDGPDAEVGIG